MRYSLESQRQQLCWDGVLFTCWATSKSLMEPSSSHSSTSQPCTIRFLSFLATRSQLSRIEQIPTTSTDKLTAYEIRYLGPNTVLKTCGPTMPLRYFVNRMMVTRRWIFLNIPELSTCVRQANTDSRCYGSFKRSDTLRPDYRVRAPSTGYRDDQADIAHDRVIDKEENDVAHDDC